MAEEQSVERYVHQVDEGDVISAPEVADWLRALDYEMEHRRYYSEERPMTLSRYFEVAKLMQAASSDDAARDGGG